MNANGPIPTSIGRELDWPPLLAAIRDLNVPARLYLVGGAVRDAVMRRPIHDLDFVIDGDSLKAARVIANQFSGAYYPLDPERGTGRAIVEFAGQRYEIDVSRFRGESLLDDLSARDFTANALAMPLDGDPNALIDPLGGVADIQAKRLRRCSPQSIPDDPLRALRAVRQSATLKLLIEPATREDVRRADLSRVSVERVRDEFMKTLDCPLPHAPLRALDSLGLLAQVVPEVTAMHNVTQSPPHVFDVWEHTLKVIEALGTVLAIINPGRTDETAADGAYGMIVYRLDRYRPKLQNHLATGWPAGRTSRALLMLAALLHDCGKPATRTIEPDGAIHFYRHEFVGAELAHERGMALRLSNEEVTRLEAVVRCHMRPMHLDSARSVTRRAIYRFWDAAQVAGLDVCVLTQADYLGIYGVTLSLQNWLAFLDVVAALLEGYFFRRESVVAPPPLLNGSDLMDALNLTPGPMVGRLLRLIAEAQAAGEVETVQQALDLARHYQDRPESDSED